MNDALHCIDGMRKELYKLECLNYLGIKKFDLELIDGSIMCQKNMTFKKCANLKFLDDERIDYLNDKLKAYMGIETDTGVKWYSLGVFLIVNPKLYNGICSTECYDGTYILHQDRIDEPKLFLKGTAYVEVLRYFLISCGITKINIQPTNLVITDDVVCDYTKSKLEWFNYFAEQINYTSLSTNEDGWFISRKYIEPSPLNVKHVYKDNELSVIADIPTVSMDYYNIPNVFIRVVSHPNLGVLKSTYTNNDPTSRFSVKSRNGRKIVDMKTIDNVANQFELDNITRKLAFDSVQIEQEVSFNTLNMPEHNLEDIYDLRHKNLKGIFVCEGYSIQLLSGSKMQHIVKRLVRLN